MSIMLLVCRAGLRREERANIHLDVCFDKTWNGWEEEHTSTSHAEIREASLWDNKRSFRKHQWTEGTFKQAHQNTHQRDIHPPCWQSPNSVTVGSVGSALFMWKALKKRQHWAVRPVKLSSGRGRSCFQIFLLCVGRWKITNWLLTAHTPVLLA